MDEYIRKLERDTSLPQNERNFLIYTAKMRVGYSMDWQEFDWIPTHSDQRQEFNPAIEEIEFTESASFDLPNGYMTYRVSHQVGADAPITLFYGLERDRSFYSWRDSLPVKATKDVESDRLLLFNNLNFNNPYPFPRWTIVLDSDHPRYGCFYPQITFNFRPDRNELLLANIPSYDSHFIFEVLGLPT